jgi:hypothetical protein
MDHSILLPTLLAIAANPAGALKITQITKNDKAVIITGTCIEGAGPVSIFFRNTATQTHFKVHGSSGECSLAAATKGRTVSIPVSAVPAGSYMALLKQGSVVSAQSIAFSLP